MTYFVIAVASVVGSLMMSITLGQLSCNQAIFTTAVVSQRCPHCGLRCFFCPGFQKVPPLRKLSFT